MIKNIKEIYDNASAHGFEILSKKESLDKSNKNSKELERYNLFRENEYIISSNSLDQINYWIYGFLTYKNIIEKEKNIPQPSIRGMWIYYKENQNNSTLIHEAKILDVINSVLVQIRTHAWSVVRLLDLTTVKILHITKEKISSGFGNKLYTETVVVLKVKNKDEYMSRNYEGVIKVEPFSFSRTLFLDFDTESLKAYWKPYISKYDLEIIKVVLSAESTIID